MAYDENLADRVRDLLPPGDVVTERHMFGGLTFMLGGHMFCGVVRDTLMARLGPGTPPTAHLTSRTCVRWTSPDGR